MQAGEPQAILTPITQAAIFLTLTVDSGGEDGVRDALSDISGLKRSVGFRIPEAQLTCVTGVGALVWDRLFGAPPPAGLHPFRELNGARHRAPATPGDLFFHIRAQRLDLCFELAQLLTERFHRCARVVDDLRAWNALTVEEQEHAFGRTKLDDVEFPDDQKAPDSHLVLNTILDEDGVQHQIVRFNMPFGRVGAKEFGTYFTGYARTPEVIEQMLQNMFIGKPPGNTDRILDFSTALTGNLFFVPTVDFLDDPPNPGRSSASEGPDVTEVVAASNDGSLGIGSLKGTRR